MAQLGNALHLIMLIRQTEINRRYTLDMVGVEH